MARIRIIDFKRLVFNSRMEFSDRIHKKSSQLETLPEPFFDTNAILRKELGQLLERV